MRLLLPQATPTIHRHFTAADREIGRYRHAAAGSTVAVTNPVYVTTRS